MKADKEILETYGTVTITKYSARWYLKDDSGRATGGEYYRQEATEVMLKAIRRMIWNMVIRLDDCKLPIQALSGYKAQY